MNARSCCLARRLAALPNEWYVIARDTAHAGRVRGLLEAAVAHTWVPFDGRVARLDSADPVQRAILDFRGQGTTFVLRPETADVEKYAVRSLRRLAASLAGRPLRVAAVPRPVGRMLREFDLALSIGSAEKSAELLGRDRAHRWDLSRERRLPAGQATGAPRPRKGSAGGWLSLVAGVCRAAISGT